MKTTWNDLGIKEKLAIGSACGAFALGWLGQSLVYTASVFGVSAYFRSEAVQLRRDMDRHLEHIEKMQIQREKIRQGIDVEEIPDKEDEE